MLYITNSALHDDVQRFRNAIEGSQVGMSEEFIAYGKAQDRITNAAQTEAVYLDFTDKDFRALNRLPPEIANLKGLQTLDLSNTQIDDIAPLASLWNLRTLDLCKTPIADIAPLTGLTELQNFLLNDTQVTDLAPLLGLKALHNLRLARTLIADVKSLANLTGLKTLDLSNLRIIDLTPLTGLKGLQRLELAYTPTKDLGPLAVLTSIEWLDLSGIQKPDFKVLSSLKNLKHLELGLSNITDLAPLAELKWLRGLRLARTPITDLAPLAVLTALEWLDFTHTQINNLVPLAGATELKSIDFRNTQITDLRPIAGLSKLADAEPFAGLHFKNTPATKRDARLAELAQIEDDRDRSIATLDYLRTLPPWWGPYTPEATPDDSLPLPIGRVSNPPEQDPALPLIWLENGFDFFATSIDSDPVTEAALSDLHDLLDDLRRKGNQHEDLYRIAEELQERSAGAISDLNMIKLHLSYQKLRRLHQGRAGRQDNFDDETVSSIEAVFDVLPGVTLADSGVKVLIERQEAERASGLSAFTDEAASKVLQDVQAPSAPFAPEVKDIAAEVIRPGLEDRLTGTRRILSSNVVISVLKWVGGATAAGALGGPVGNFVYDNGRDLLAYAATMGDDALFWAQAIIAKFRVEYELATGIAREIAGASAHRKLPSPLSSKVPE